MPLGSAQFNLHQLMGSLRTSEETPVGLVARETLPVWPFVTISRQAGSGGIKFGRLLAEHLNHHHPSHQYPWHALDRELVERIAADHHLSTELIDSLEKSSHSWISEFIAGLSHTDRSPSELAVFRRVVETMRALARAGHVILIGLAGVLITRDMPRGLHVRIIAPLEWRIRNLARNDGLSEADARAKVHLLDRDREAFVARFWPNLADLSQVYHITLNASLLSEEQMTDCVAPLVASLASARGADFDPARLFAAHERQPFPKAGEPRAKAGGGRADAGGQGASVRRRIPQVAPPASLSSPIH